MNGLFIEKFKMYTHSLIALGTLLISILILFILSLLFINLIRKQIDQQIKEIIPIKFIRNRIGVRIKFKR